MKPVLMSALLLVGCATTEATSAPATPRVADQWPSNLSVPSAGSPRQAIERARGRLTSLGFAIDQAAVSGQEPLGDALVLSDDRRDPGRCFGTTEVIAVNAKPDPMGSRLHFACVTAAWSEPEGEGPCLHSDSLGCPMGGDKAAAAMAFDALSSL